ncbi:MAG: DUF1570 domain-containing protein [Planctomycetota bacterium]
MRFLAPLRDSYPAARLWLACWLGLAGACHPGGDCAAVEHVLVNRNGGLQRLSGEVLEEDSVGSLLLATDEGGLWPISADSIEERTSDSAPLVRLDGDQLGARLREELGENFQLHDSKNYIVCFNTTQAYAKWCSSLLERLQKAFISFWKKKGCDIEQPEEPLAVLVFGDRRSYERYAKQDLGGSVGNAIGYYSLQTNRIVMYDLTGSQSLRRQTNRRGKLQDITALLRQPAAEPLVATVVHEATHQIAYNCGLQKRYVDNPVWLSEGMAMYFETPDLRSNRSWRGIGLVNYARWDLFVQNDRAGKNGTLKDLIASDDRFRNGRTAVDAYAEAWAWNYFLIKWRGKDYVDYLDTLRAKPLLRYDSPAQRVADFEKHFGDLAELEEEFVRRMRRID